MTFLSASGSSNVAHWKGPDGLGDWILYRNNEQQLRSVAVARRFAFDGDSLLFRLASEAFRIRLAHLFDPYVAVNASQIEPLPHQLPERRAYSVSYNLSPGEAHLYGAVTRYVLEEMNRADGLAEDGSRRRNNVGFALQILQRRLEQRFGRIHRIGQTEVCHLWNLVAAETREGAVYQRLLEKLETARETLGGKVYDVLGELFEARPLRDLFMEAIRYGDREDVQERLFQAVDGAVDVGNINELVPRNTLTREGLDPATVRSVREEIERAAAQRLQPHHIQSFFEAAFEQAGGNLRRRERGRFELTRVPPILRDRDRLIGRSAPVLQRYRRICFNKDSISGQPQAVLVAPGHPLLDSLIDLTLERYRELLTRGAVLIDGSDQQETPRVLVILRHATRDGRKSRHG